MFGSNQIIENKYFKCYLNIIENRRNNLKKDQEYEKHHIVPRSFGGKNNKENLVFLTLREHLLCHILLTKFSIEKFRLKMIYGLYMMMSRMGIKSSREYEKIKKEVVKYKKELMNEKIEKGEWISPFCNKKTHNKTMLTREKNKSNIFITNNPMFNDLSIFKKVEKTSGKNHYMKKRGVIYEFKKIQENNWQKLNIEESLEKTLNEMKWSYATFFKVLNTKKPTKKGEMKDIIVRRIFDENYKN